MINYLGTLSGNAALEQLPGTAFAFSFNHRRDYNDNSQILLHAVLDPETSQLTVSPDSRLVDPDRRTEVEAPVLNLLAPLALGTRSIAKPWGHEIWYTGIEARGVCDIEGIPLPHFVHALQYLGMSDSAAPILLKILAPSADRVLGDLYFELHEHKQEVYVVTDVSEQAWGNGPGKLRYGFDPDVVNQYENETAFKSAFLRAARSYEAIRRDIDLRLDAMKEQEGLTDPLNSRIQQQLMLRLPLSLQQQEAELREQMERFTHFEDVRVGDVLRIEKFVPHSLQHGVRVIEFQTPHYERHILSFAQKVVTQDHWDTEEALAKANMKPATVVQPGDLDTIVAFEEFSVDRLTLAPGQQHVVKTDTYRLLIGVRGTVDCRGRNVSSEQGFYLSQMAGDVTLSNQTNENAVVLVAKPERQSG